MKIVYILLFILIFLSSNSGAQVFMLGVAPLNPNNFWKYQDLWSFVWPTYFLVTDSTINLGDNTYYVVETFNQNFTNKNTQYFGLSADNFYLRYGIYYPDSIYRYHKKNCKLGDSWMQLAGNTTFEYSVIDTFTITTWGESFFSKVIKITDYSLTEVYQLWTDSIGLIEENSIGQYHMILTGCVINGKVYGDTSVVTSIEEEIELHDNYYLSQNYPNPFNPSTTISFSIPERSFVTLKIYDMLGREVAQLVNEELETGNFEKTFDASTLSSGVYIYKISAMKDGNILFSESKQMLMIK